jgi:hypothetical protein
VNSLLLDTELRERIFGRWATAALDSAHQRLAALDSAHQRLERS